MQSDTATTDNLLLSHSKKCTKMILSAKNKCVLNNPETAPKSYWSILNRFHNNMKIPSVSPTVKLCQTSRKRPIYLIHFLLPSVHLYLTLSVLLDISFHTSARLSLSITEKDILAIINLLGPNESHGWDNISIKIIKMCSESLVLLLKIFEAALNDGVFPDDCKKGNIVRVHKDLKTMLINCRPISLLPIFAKIFENSHVNVEYFIENKLFTVCQSGFLPGDSCTSQLLSIIHEIHKSIGENPPIDVRGTFLDISKAFDKLKSHRIFSNLLKLIENYLTDRKQKVILNSQTSSWKRVVSGVPQGSILGLLFFLIYINDLPDGIYLQNICG